VAVPPFPRAPHRHGHARLKIPLPHTLAGRLQLAGLGPVQLEHLQLPEPRPQRARRPLYVCLTHRVGVLRGLRRPGRREVRCSLTRCGLD
jgi:hypothetical protein